MSVPFYTSTSYITTLYDGYTMVTTSFYQELTAVYHRWPYIPKGLMEWPISHIAGEGLRQSIHAWTK
jgi:hypothetical protein